MQMAVRAIDRWKRGRAARHQTTQDVLVASAVLFWAVILGGPPAVLFELMTS
jgi:hypothetical protein